MHLISTLFKSSWISSIHRYAVLPLLRSLLPWGWMNIVVHIQYKIWKSERNMVEKSCWNTSFLFADTFSGCDWTTDKWSCCSTSHPCGPLEGDCDSNEDCINHLLCGDNNCFDSFSSSADCCYDPVPCKTTIIIPVYLLLSMFQIM